MGKLQNTASKRKRVFLLVAILLLLVIVLNGCTTVSANRPDPPEKKTMEFRNTVVSLTFDDGDADNFFVRETLSRNKLRATFYVVSGFTGTEGYMTEGELRALYEDGNEIGGHSLSHASLPDLPRAELRQEICQDRLNLLAMGFDVVSFAYPGGKVSEDVTQTVRDCGYNSARARAGGSEEIPPEDVFLLRPMPYIVNDTRFPKMLRYITDVERDGGGWVIFTFHHVCDGCDYYAVTPALFDRFADWLGEQQANGLVIKTVGEVIGGDVKPGVAP